MNTMKAIRQKAMSGMRVVPAVVAMSLTLVAHAQFGGGMGGGDASQLVTILNNALNADMNPTFKAQFDQTCMQQIMGRIQIGPESVMRQQAVTLTTQLMQRYDRLRGDDNKRAGLVLFLSACGMSGRTPNDILSSLRQLFAEYDQSGQTWHRRGSFGAVAGQLLANGGVGGMPAPSMPVQFPAFGGGGIGGGSSGGGVCSVCHGTGTCQTCHGTGSFRMYGESTPCERYCTACGGTGRR